MIENTINNSNIEEKHKKLLLQITDLFTLLFFVNATLFFLETNNGFSFGFLINLIGFLIFLIIQYKIYKKRKQIELKKGKE